MNTTSNEDTTQVVIPQTAPLENIPQQSRSKLAPAFVSIAVLIVLGCVAYGAYWYQTERDFSQRESVQNIEEQVPEIQPVTEELPSEIIQSANPITGEASVGYAVENQFGGYFLILSVDATSTAGAITEFSVWADEDVVQPWDTFGGDVGMTVNLATEKKSAVYVQFKDAAGNVSEKIIINQEMIEAARKDI